jgi:hypothetical protein
MTRKLILRALQHAHALCRPPIDLQYTSAAYRKQLSEHGMLSSLPSRGTEVSGKGIVMTILLLNDFLVV